MAYKVPKVLSYHGFDPDEHSASHALACNDASKARQADAKEADINTIVKNFGVTGTLPQPIRLPTYQDFEDIFDFRSAMDAVRAAEVSFMQVPAQVRAQFQNDPQAFVEFCSEKENLPQLREWGLAPPAPSSQAEPEPAKPEG